MIQINPRLSHFGILPAAHPVQGLHIFENKEKIAHEANIFQETKRGPTTFKFLVLNYIHGNTTRETNNYFAMLPEVRVFSFSVVLVSQHAMLLFDSSATITVKMKVRIISQKQEIERSSIECRK